MMNFMATLDVRIRHSRWGGTLIPPPHAPTPLILSSFTFYIQWIKGPATLI